MVPDRGPGTGTNYEKRKWNTTFRSRENGPTFSDFPLFLGIFQWDEPTKRVPFTAEPEIPEILTKRKAPEVQKVSVQEKISRYQTLVSSLPRMTVFRHRRPKTELRTGPHRQPSKQGSCFLKSIIPNQKN